MIHYYRPPAPIRSGVIPDNSVNFKKIILFVWEQNNNKSNKDNKKRDSFLFGRKLCLWGSRSGSNFHAYYHHVTYPRKKAHSKVVGGS